MYKCSALVTPFLCSDRIVDWVQARGHSLIPTTSIPSSDTAHPFTFEGVILKRPVKDSLLKPSLHKSGSAHSVITYAISLLCTIAPCSVFCHPAVKVLKLLYLSSILVPTDSEHCTIMCIIIGVVWQCDVGVGDVTGGWLFDSCEQTC